MKLLYTCILLLPFSRAVAGECVDYAEGLNVIGAIETRAHPFHIDAADSLACIASGDSGLAVVDVVNPSTPKVIGRVDTPGMAQSVAIVGSHAYVADGTFGLQVVDIGDPRLPEIVATVPTAGSAMFVAAGGERVYVAEGDTGMRIVDVSNPGAPVVVGGVDTPGEASDVSVSGNWALVADRGNGLQVVNVSNPAMPVIVGNESGFAAHVAARGNHAYVSDFNELRVVDFSSPAAPVSVGNVNVPGGNGVTVHGSFAFVSDYDGGFQVVDVSNPANPRWVGGHGKFATAVAVIDSMACVTYAGAFRGLKVIDVTNPVSPVPMGSVRVSEGYGLAVAGNYAYVVDHSLQSLVVVDTSNPSSPQIVGSEVTFDSTNDVAVLNNHAYVADENGLQVLDITDPENPQHVGGIPISTFPTWVAVGGGFVYVATDLSWTFYVIDIANPLAPMIRGTIPNLGGDIALTLSGHALIADRTGLVVADISNPDSPAVVARMDMASGASGVAIAGNTAYVVGSLASLQGGNEESVLVVVDVSNPTSPVIVGQAAAPDRSGRVAVMGNTAYVTDETGVAAFDVAVSSAPTYLGSGHHQGFSADVATAGGRVFVSSFNTIGGFWIFPSHCANPSALAETPDRRESAPLALRPAWPNPGRGHAVVEFDLPHPDDVRLEIYDVGGRHVRRLLAGPVVAGRHVAHWDGRNGNGAAVPAGTYVVRLTSRTKAASGRMTILR